MKVEGATVKQLLEEGIDVDEGEEVNLLHSSHPPIMIRGEDGVLYQVNLHYLILTCGCLLIKELLLVECPLIKEQKLEYNARITKMKCII